jgi:hypothetical protein
MTESAKTGLLERFSREALGIGEHTVAFITAILSIWLVELVLEQLLGTDATFYDRIPVSYVIDTGHLAVFVRFIWKLALQIWSKE